VILVGREMKLRPEVFALVRNDAPRKRALEELLATAANALTQNIHRIDGKDFLAAGGHQFKSLWTRDFCWSARGLLAIGRGEVVVDQIERLLTDPGEGRPADLPNLLPRTLDSMNTDRRVLFSAPTRASYPLVSPLHAFYLDQHRRPSFDGNMLAVLSADLHRKVTGDTTWWNANEGRLVKALQFYDIKSNDGTPRFRRDGLLDQPPFSDWQDSVNRAGPTFYCNMVYACVLEAVSGDAAFAVDRAGLRAFRQKIEDTFFDPRTGLYLSVRDRPQISLDGNLLAIDLGYLPPDRTTALLQALRRHTLWTGLPEGPGFVTTPAYPARDKDFVDHWLASLGGYHDSLYWSWLMALSAKLAAMNPEDGAGAEALAIFDRLSNMAARDGSIAEIFKPAQGLPRYDTLTYNSEMPFSWGAAFVVDALASTQSTPSSFGPTCHKRFV
jgi:glycogen debranching enzyme